MTEANAIFELENLRNQECTHSIHVRADDIILEALRDVRPDVVEAYEVTRQVVGFWYS